MMTVVIGQGNYDEETIKIFQKHYNPTKSQTWPFYPIVMPLLNGQGPASDEECDEITWEVWDRFLDTFGSYKTLPEALNVALTLNTKVINATFD